MSFARLLADEFDPVVRDRGRHYYEQRRVNITENGPDEVRAHVRGSHLYSVVVKRGAPPLKGSCDCDYFAGGEPCKHLWATILQSDVEGPAASPLSSTPPSPAVPDWQRTLDLIAGADRTKRAEFRWPPGREVVYLVDLDGSVRTGEMVLEVRYRDQRKGGGFSRADPIEILKQNIDLLPGPDRLILRLLTGGNEFTWFGVGGNYMKIPHTYSIRYPLSAAFLDSATPTGRCFLKTRGAQLGLPLEWNGGEPWQFVPEIRHAGNSLFRLWGTLRRDGESIDIREPMFVTAGGIFIHRNRAERLAENTAFDLLLRLRTSPAIHAPTSDAEAFLQSVLRLPGVERVELPDELRFEEAEGVPEPCARVGFNGRDIYIELSFEYEGKRIAHDAGDAAIFVTSPRRRLIRRNFDLEQQAAAALQTAGARYGSATEERPVARWSLAAGKLQSLLRTLLDAHWHVELKGARMRRPSSTSLAVSSGIDWFELTGKAEYGGVSASLPELLEAAKEGSSFVRLPDGSYGMLPEEWLRKIALLTGMGTPDENGVRFRRSQAGLLDALLAAQPEASFDETFAKARGELQSFRGIEQPRQPAEFTGAMRDYQREGLGWMEFLRRCGLGGCLADDMGVGKTVQVLALLETRRAAREAGEPIPPSLVVVPRSLIFNWKEESARFTPRLRLIDYTGTARGSFDLPACDVVLTTYGTLRRDVPKLREIRFDYVVLDEAQAVKNASSESSKAVRLLQGDNRLAMSGTPIENRLEELWSLFEFLNPGMLGSAALFRSPAAESRELLAYALRPFILRRTKEQVARELPPRTEQTIYCELEPPQRKLYNELRQHYRTGVLGKVDAIGMARSKIQVLEALLRLRQAACHPGLIDAAKKNEASAKLEVLTEKLGEIVAEGHKALVFSQFTSLLAIVRQRLQAEGLRFEYLDGKTKDRQERVENFQSADGPPVFLISLKAGGLGLNLTAAGYVFLLDPWWNPAVEAQAVDRAHRIGQTRHVFAYRLIARDTVEEKVLELQKTKRDLAEAIIGEDNSLIRDLKMEDLELLLS